MMAISNTLRLRKADLTQSTKKVEIMEFQAQILMATWIGATVEIHGVRQIEDLY